MSDIFGYTGKNSAKEILLSGLSRMKSANKDMAGFVLKEENYFKTFKIKGSPEDLSIKAKPLESNSTIGLAQCSREEKCKASSLTAPPSSNEAFAVVCDGEIENFKALKKWCAEPFPILTNEDLLLASLCKAEEKSKIALIEKTSAAIHSNISFAFISAEENAIYCKSSSSKLIIGISEGGSFVSSELGALLPFCEKYAVLESGESAKLLSDRVLFFDSKMKRIKKSFKNVTAGNYSVNNSISAGEIYCCPLAVKETFSRFIHAHRIDFDFLKLGSRFIEKINKIVLIAQGDEYLRALASKSLFETYCGITALSFTSKEFIFSNTPIDKNSLVIAINSNGENKETLFAINKAKEFGAKTIALTKNKSSALMRECAGAIISGNESESNMKESNYISDYLTLCLFALYLSSKLEIVSDLYLGVSLKMAEMLSGITSAVIKRTPKLETASKTLEETENIFLTSANADFSICLEAQRIIRQTTNKLIKTIGAEELSNYPEALITGSSVFVLITDKEHYQYEINNIYRLKNRGANVIIITSESIEEELEDFENVISFTDSLSVFNIIPCLVCVYKIALLSKEGSQNKGIEQSA